MQNDYLIFSYLSAQDTPTIEVELDFLYRVNYLTNADLERAALLSSDKLLIENWLETRVRRWWVWHSCEQLIHHGIHEVELLDFRISVGRLHII